MFLMNIRFMVIYLCKNVIVLEFVLLECFIDIKKNMKFVGINFKIYGLSCFNLILIY